MEEEKVFPFGGQSEELTKPGAHEVSAMVRCGPVP